MVVLIFGDVVGRIGRKAIVRAIADWRTAYAPDFIVANNENLAHGHGISERTVDELFNAGVDVLTGGDHTIATDLGCNLLADPRYAGRLLRPENYQDPHIPGAGVTERDVGQFRVAVINLQCKLFMKLPVEEPLAAFDRIWSGVKDRVSIVLVDCHGEATSERAGLAWYADSRATAVWGTHTHVPTADERILPGGTAFQTDVGFTGFADGVIGFTKENGIARLMRNEKGPADIPETGRAVANALLVTADPKTGRTTVVRRLQKIFDL